MDRHNTPVRICLVLGAMLVTSAAATQPGKYVGPCALVVSKDAGTIYVACADAQQVAWVELPAGKVTRRVPMPGEPTALALTPDGARLVVTCAAPKSTVVVIDARTGEVTSRIPVGHTASGLAITPDGKRAYVCNRFDDDVSVVDLTAGKEVARISAVREPVAAAVTGDGTAVLVANLLPNAPANAIYVEEVAAAVTVINTRTNLATAILLPSGSHSLRALCVAPDGKHAYVTHILSNFLLTTTQLDQGWINMNVVSVIDMQQRKVVNTVALDDVFHGAGNPWGAGLSADGKTIVVAHAGSHELSVLSAPAMLSDLEQLYMSPLVGAIPFELRQGIRQPRRIALPGKGPRGLAVVGTKVFVAEYFSDTLAVVDLSAKEGDPVGTIALGPKPEMTLERRGEFLFHDASICYENWQSCLSCHPDGRHDALNWDLMNDGIGNFKNTKSLLLVHKTPPTMAEAVRPSAEACVRAGLLHILFADRPEEEAVAIDAYLKSLKPVPSPRLAGGRLSPSAERGKLLFEGDRGGCHECHPAPLYTDLKMHNVGTRGRFEYADRFDTPTLIEVWRTAPYLHDGRYVTVEELIVKGTHGSSHGDVEELSDREIADLVEFVLSL